MNNRASGQYECNHGLLFQGSCSRCALVDMVADPDKVSRELASLRYLWERLCPYMYGDITEHLVVGHDGMKGIAHVKETYDLLDGTTPQKGEQP